MTQIWPQSNAVILEIHHYGAATLQDIFFFRSFEMILDNSSKNGPLVRNRFDIIKQNVDSFFAVAKINFDLTHVYKQKCTDEKKMCHIQDWSQTGFMARKRSYSFIYKGYYLYISAWIISLIK